MILTLIAITLCIAQSRAESFPTLTPLNGNGESKTCNAWMVGMDAGRVICLCNQQVGCGKLTFDWPLKPGQAKLVQSSKTGLRFQVSNVPSTSSETNSRISMLNQEDQATTVRINFTDARQSIVGWGGAFTDSTGINLKSLSPDLVQKLMQSYFGQDGLQYNIGRVPIGGADFSPRAYSYDDSSSTTNPDYELKNWTLAREDTQYKIPYIKMAMEIVANSSSSSSDGLKLFGSPWSPPKWMKTNKSFVRGFLIDEDKVYKAYAEYLVKFYKAYEENGIKFWGATIQNEPITAFWPGYYFNSLQFGDQQMIKFVGQYLGPALVKQGKTKENFKLMVGDDSLNAFDKQVLNVMADLECQKYIAGLAFHWYGSSNNSEFYNSLPKVYEAIKDKIEFVLMSEACNGWRDVDVHKVDLGSWERGEAYVSDIIEDLARRTSGWVDWNLALDLEGGPNWVKNFVDSPVIVNGRKNEFYLQPMYHALGHFSRLFRPGSIVLGTSVKAPNNDPPTDIMASTAFDPKSGHLIVNIMNKDDDARLIQVALGGYATNSASEGNSSKLSDVYYKLQLEPRSINSFVLKL